MTIKSYINKVLKGNKQETIPKNINMIGDKYLNIAFESVGEKVLQLKKDKSLTKDEADILQLAIKKAIDHGPLLDKYDDVDQRILNAQKILRKGRIKQNLTAALDLIMEREKYKRHARIQWHAIAERYRVLTEDQKPPLTPKAAIKKLAKEFKHQSGPALLKGLRSFIDKTQIQAFKNTLKTLPWSVK